MHNKQLPWTKGGLELLSRIESIISDNGGTAVMYEVAKNELSQTAFWNNKVREQEIFRVTLRHNIPYKQACNLIPMPIHTFARKIAEYKRTKAV